MPHALEFLTESLPGFAVGVPQHFQIQVDGGSPPYTFKITSGALPAALTLSNKGIISGAVKGAAAGTTILSP